MLFFSSFPGGLFDAGDGGIQEIAFRKAIDRVNKDHDVLPNTKLLAQIDRIVAGDSFRASKQGELLEYLRTDYFCVNSGSL